MLTPIHLITNQSEECPQADQALCNPHPDAAFKNLSLKSIKGFPGGISGMGAPDHTLPGSSTPPPPSNGWPLPPQAAASSSWAPGQGWIRTLPPALRNAPSAILFFRPRPYQLCSTRCPWPPLLVAEGTLQTWAAQAAGVGVVPDPPEPSACRTQPTWISLNESRPWVRAPSGG